MEKSFKNYRSAKLWVETMPKLKELAELTGKGMAEIADETITEALAKVKQEKKEQLDNGKIRRLRRS